VRTVRDALPVTATVTVCAAGQADLLRVAVTPA